MMHIFHAPYHYERIYMRHPATDINSKQIRILEYITNCLQNEYRCPTVREICEYIGLSSTSTVHSHLNALERFGYIKRDKNKNRSISVMHMPKTQPSVNNTTNECTTSEEFEFMGSHLRQIPLVGTVQAGAPITAIQNIEDMITLPIQLTGNSDCFLLKVQGESMIQAGILEGDLLIVRQQNVANNGDIVVARIDDEATVKRFFKESDHIRLQPENDAFSPIITQNCVIEGLVIGLVRDSI